MAGIGARPFSVTLVGIIIVIDEFWKALLDEGFHATVGSDVSPIARRASARRGRWGRATDSGMLVRRTSWIAIGWR